MTLAILLSHPLVSALVAMSGLSLLFGGVLGYASSRFRVDGDPLIDEVDDLLPQSQCGQCGFPGCRPYAEAVVNQTAAISQCPAGGQTVIKSIASLLGVEPPTANDSGLSQGRLLAYIDETDCHGCGKCMRICPFDAIIGTSRQLHTVFRDECTGCGLCLPVCDTACISMQPAPVTTQNWLWHQPPPTAISVTLPRFGIQAV